MKKTKIIGTVGPASREKAILRKMIQNGMDIVRINMTYADYSFCKEIAQKIDELNEELHKNVALMLDLKGPDINVGAFEGGEAYFTKGDKIRIYANDILGDSTKFSTSYPNLIKEIKMNTIIKLNDGLMVLKTVDRGEDYLICEVLEGGYLQNNNSMNVIGLKLALPFLSEKDKQDIAFAHEIKASFLGLSFVSSSEDVLEVSDLLITLGDDHIALISKIENERAFDDIDEIIKVSDAVMIARGDLGVEMPLERVPGIQKAIIHKCHHMGKVSIVATEMLSSMESAIRPTRAEVSDIANAVLDGVDVVMLSGETTIGEYPVECLDMMAKIIESSEEDLNYYEMMDKAARTERVDITGSIAYSVVECSNKLKARAIVTPTMTGYTAKKISRFRPMAVIVALSPDPEVVKNLSMYYAVYPVLIPEVTTFDKMIKMSRDTVKQVLETNEKDRIIITGGYPFKDTKHTNFMKIEEL